MGQIIHPQKKEIKGPWLLNHDDFEALDGVIQSIDSFLYQSWLEKIKSDIQNENKEISEEELNKRVEDSKTKSWYYKHVKECQLTSKDETKLSDESVLGLLKDQTLSSLKPKSFTVKIRHGGIIENSFELKISNFYKGELSYDISCYDPSIKDEIQYEIDKWIDKRKPNRALQIWSNYGDLITFTFIVPIILLGIESFSTSYTTYQETLVLEMFELAKEGINETNRDMAIELLIKSKSGYRPDDFNPIEKPNNPIWIRLFAVSVFIYIASYFRPKTLIGLGKMKSKLVIYKVWIKLVLITLPAILILGPFWKTIVKWFY